MANKSGKLQILLTACGLMTQFYERQKILSHKAISCDCISLFRKMLLSEITEDPLINYPLPNDLPKPKEPFIGLRPFTRKEARIFFGREAGIANLISRISKESVDAEPIVLFYGQSGVGKSSLLHAGVLPRLEKHYDIRYKARETTGLLATLKQALNSNGNSLIEAWQEQEKASQKPTVIILDQLEEAYTQHNTEKGNREVTELATSLREVFLSENKPQGKLVLGFRQGWLANVQKIFDEKELAYDYENFLQPLDEKGVTSAITGASEALNSEGDKLYPLIFAQTGKENDNTLISLPAAITRDVIDEKSPTAPILQFLLSAMWKAAKTKDRAIQRFNNELYQPIKASGLGLEDFLNNKLEKLAKDFPTIVNTGLALDILKFHVTDYGTAGQQNRQEIHKRYSHYQPEELNNFLQACLNEHLLSESISTDDQTLKEKPTRLAHDTLAAIVEKQFSESNKVGQQARRILESSKVGWYERDEEGNIIKGEKGHSKIKKNASTLSGQQLITVNKGKLGTQVWDSFERHIVNRSFLQTLVFWSVIALVSLGALGFGIWQFRLAKGNELKAKKQTEIATKNAEEAKNQANISSSRQLVAETLLVLQNPNLSIDDIEKAALLAVQASKERSHRETSSNVLHALRSFGSLNLIMRGHNGDVSSVAFSPSSKTVVSGSQDGTLRLWDVETGQAIGGPWKGHTDTVSSVAFSPDGKIVVSGSEDTTVRLWDVETGEVIGDPWPGHTSYVLSVAFSPDGKTVVSGGRNNPENHGNYIILLWDVQDTDKISRLEKLCRIAGRNFTKEEWLQYLEGKSYELTCHQYPVSLSGIELWLIEATTDLDTSKAQELYAQAKNATEDYTNKIFVIESWLKVMNNALQQGKTQLTEQMWSDVISWGNDLDASQLSFLGTVVRDFAIASFITPKTTHFVDKLYTHLVEWTVKTEDAKLNSNTCWNGSLYSFAKTVLPACEQAVTLAEHSNSNSLGAYRDNRGLALALSGNLEKAIPDFDFYAEVLNNQGGSEQNIISREHWVTKLKEGENPFTKEVMNWLREGSFRDYPLTE